MPAKFIACLAVFLVMAFSQYTRAAEKDSASCTTHCRCGNENISPAGVMIAHLHPKKEWMLSARWMNMNMSGLLSGSESVSPEAVFNNYLMAPDNMQMNMFMLMGMYGFTRRLTGMVMVNYNSTSMHMTMFAPDAHHHPGSTTTSGDHTMLSSGLGDTKLYALYGILNKQRHQLLVSAGVSLPTGSITEKGTTNDMMYPGKRYPYSMQSGSGTYDLLPCINYLFAGREWIVASQVSAVVRTGENTIGYRLGNEYTSSNWVAYKWLDVLSSSFRVDGTFSNSITGHDPSLYRYAEPSSNTMNYGGKRVTGFVGSFFQVGKGSLNGLGIGAEYGIPLYQYVNGIQMKQQHTLHISVAYGF